MFIPTRRSFGKRQLTLCVMMFVLLLRSLVPTGFMPNAGALRDGRLEMAFCSGVGGAQIITIDTHDHTSSDTSTSDVPGNHQSQSGDCPFSVLSALPAMPTMALSLVGLPLFFTHIQAVQRTALLPTASPRGPPLGSRAPPFHLV
jgi:hypothetical protein